MSCKTKWIPIIVKAVAVIGLLVAFVFQVRGSVIKFIEGKTVLTSDTSQNDFLILPPIALCPSYRPNAFGNVTSQHGLPHDNDEQIHFVNTLRNWESHTFNLHDFVTQVEVALEPDKSRLKWGLDNLDKPSKNGVKIRTFHSSFGRCYIIEVPSPK